MDLNHFTQKSQEALGEAQKIAIQRGHQEVDGEHLLLALLDQAEGLVPRLLQSSMFLSTSSAPGCCGPWTS